MTQRLRTLLFMDDTTLLAKTPNELQELTKHYLHFCRMFRIRVNTTKSKVMRFTRDKGDAGEMSMLVDGHAPPEQRA